MGNHYVDATALLVENATTSREHIMRLITPTRTKKVTRHACGIVAMILVILAFALEGVTPFGVMTTLIYITLLGIAAFFANIAHPLRDILERCADIMSR